MKRSIITSGIVVAVVLQFFILTGMVVKASLPLWTGNEIHVKTIPIDPRSMFRGNYARLNYEFNRLPAKALEGYPRLRVGEIVYVTLKQEENGLYSFKDASLNKPDKGKFMRGRAVNTHRPYRLKYGIEAFFAPKKKALQLEKNLRNGGVAVLMITDEGRVALKDIVPDKLKN